MHTEAIALLRKYMPYSADFIHWLENYGPIEIIDPDEFKQGDYDPNLIWTETWNGPRLIANGFINSEESDFVTFYYVASQPCLKFQNSEHIIAEANVHCADCSEDSKSLCQTCNGEQSILVDFCELIF